jgi:starch synthase
VGGLKDTVVSYPQPECTGFTFRDITPQSFLEAIETAVGVWMEQTQWRAMQRRAMMQDFSWLRSAREYIEIYSALTEPGPLP